MDFDIGVVCGGCDTLNTLGSVQCRACQSGLSLVIKNNKLSIPPTTGLTSEENVTISSSTTFSKLTKEELMEQARNFVCKSCSSGVPVGHKFCGKCGTGVPPEILNAQTLFFGEMQNPARAKLVVIRGKPYEGMSFHLTKEEHIIGIEGQIAIADDPYVSKRHANFFYKNNQLFIRDEGSLNGVYFRIRGSAEIALGDFFLAGEQLFRIEAPHMPDDGVGNDGTQFYASPKTHRVFRTSQILAGGTLGSVFESDSTAIVIGRQNSDLNFPDDPFISSNHCRIEMHPENKIVLTDLNSRNGTYIRIRAEHELTHGDYVFIGQKLLRVEMNAN